MSEPNTDTIPSALSKQVQDIASRMGIAPKGTPKEDAAPAGNAAPAANPAPAQKDAPKDDDSKGESKRDDKGRFQPKEQDDNVPKMREALKAAHMKNREISRALEEVVKTVADLKKGTQPAEEPRWKKKMAEILPDLPPETQGFVKTRLAPILDEFHAEMASMQKPKGDDPEDAKYERELRDFVEDATFDGFDVNPQAILAVVAAYEKEGMSLGRTPRQQFERAHKILLAQAPKVSAEEAKKREEAEAAAKKRGAGVPPGQTNDIEPDRRASRDEYGKQLRAASLAGDYNRVRELTSGPLSSIVSKMRASKEWRNPQE